MSAAAVQVTNLQDTGFVSKQGARASVRRMKLRCGLKAIEASAARLLEALDQDADAARKTVQAAIDRGVGLDGSGTDRLVCDRPVDSVEGKDMREQQLLQGADLILQFLDTLGAGLGHGLFSVVGRMEAMPAGNAGHRLSGAAK
jgi:hypothetical protein